MRQKTKDCYKILGVDKKATSEEIKKAYREKALKYHPDRHSGNKEYENKIKEINEAYGILSDKSKRQAYDNPSLFKHSLWNNFGHPTADGIGINFGGFTVNFENGTINLGGMYIKKDIKIGLNISLKDAYCGCKKSINYQRKIYHDNNKKIYTTGKNESLTVEIPPKTKKHNMLKLEKMGNIDINGDEGDLYIIVDYPPEGNNYLVQNDWSIVCLLTIPMINILKEDILKHYILGGKDFVEIHLNSSKKNGSHYRIAGKGFNNADFIAKIFYEVPTNISQEDRKEIIKILEKYQS